MRLLSWRQKLATAFLYATRVTLHPRLSYSINTRKTTGHQIRDYCVAKGVEYSKTAISMPTDSAFPPCNLHFVACPDAATDGPTVLFVHGGGYLFPMVGECHIPLALHMGSSSKAKQAVFLEYTLSSSLQYPGQLVQISEAVRHLFEQGVQPSDLIIAGDSAGGHLVAGLCAHIAEPCPQVRPIDLRGQQLRAAILLSPWMDMEPAGVYGEANEAYDVLSQGQLCNMARLLGIGSHDLWCEPFQTSHGKDVFLRAFTETAGTKPLVGKVLVTAGEREVLFECCKKFALSFANAKTVIMDYNGKRMIKQAIEEETAVFAVGAGEVHVQSGVDIAVGHVGGGTMFALTAFLQSLSQ